jgi:hypothetical protein
MELAPLSATSIVASCIVPLRLLEQQGPESWHSTTPWAILLLMRYALAFGNTAPTPIGIIEGERFERLLHLVQSLHEHDPFLAQRNLDGVTKFLRRTGYQQFWLQQPFNKGTIGRQATMFAPDSPIIKELQPYFKWNLSLIPELSLAVWMILRRPDTGYMLETSALTKLNFGKRAVTGFLRMLSLTENEARQRALSGPILNEFLWSHERSQFTEQPLLRLNHQYVLPSLASYQICISQLHRKVASLSGHPGSEHVVGKAVEYYTNQALTDCGLKFHTDNEWDHLASYSGKRPDFVIPLRVGTLLIESKAARLQPIVGAYPSQAAMMRATNSNVSAAYRQAATFAEASQTPTWQGPKLAAPFYLLVVTDTDLHLGPGPLAWDEFLNNAVRNDLSESQIALLPKTHIGFISIVELDELTSMQDCESKLELVLQRLANDNQTLATMKATLSMQITDVAGNSPVRQSLSTAYEQVFSRLLLRLPDYNEADFKRRLAASGIDL